ncbi:hypothetical protein [Streptomyces muensis]|uniref:Uncharacterized protein n=1 Tax=Streptomyces muensis TaxID=1077944 RepID=A0A9X1Q4B0_STRM4|nr:hypothetical protein [Streptomyces muensis]MCF1598291.1 hypothetical protein [Streptomyces muensis]
MSAPTAPRTDQPLVIGRIVHYVSRGSADGRYPSTCRAALVTAVDEAGQPALVVFSPEGFFFSGPLPHADATPLAPGTWHWPTIGEDGSRCA